jgi:hypothetical protein
MNAVPRFETFTRLGFAARGVLYILIAYLAIAAGRNADSTDVLRSMAEGGASRLVLGLIALGLLAYGAWRCLEAAMDLEGAGPGAKGAATRLGHGMSGVAHGVMGLLAAGLALGVVGSDGGGGQGADKATGLVMTLPAGGLLLRLVAVGFILGGLAEGWSAYRLKFLEQLDPRAAARPWVRWVGRLGYIARGIVFILIGLLLWKAAGAHNPDQAGGVGEALGSLSGTHRIMVAGGLGFFGMFSLVQAVYRRITNPHVLHRLEASLPSARAAARRP